MFVKFFVYLCFALGACHISTLGSPLKRPSEVGFDKVKLSDDFWLPRLDAQSSVTIPFALQNTEPTVDSLRRTAAYLKGDKNSRATPHPFWASDLFKIMESASYSLMIRPNPELEKKLDQIIDVIAAAQQPDGYCYETHICKVQNNESKYGKTPYSNLVHSHELYNVGHMYEGAVAYFKATGKSKWLDVSKKSAAHVNKVFFEGDSNYNGGKPVMQAPGHEEIELALCKLYNLTGDKTYIDMAKKFLDIRGITYKPGGEGVMADDYAQQHLPVAQQREPAGHVVRALYLYTGMADVDAILGSSEYDAALNSIWNDIVGTRIAVTGGLGAISAIESFGGKYYLPNATSYNETCAAVANVFFNWRMFLLNRHAKYLDVMEVSLFNGALAGINLKGDRFLYVNPLEFDGNSAFNQGTPGRSPWFGCACCPPNISRLIMQIAGFMYAYDNDSIWLTLYATSSTSIKLGGEEVAISQKSEYPFGEKTNITFSLKKPAEFSLRLRIPEWTGSAFMPGEIYTFAEKPARKFSILLNGKPISAKIENGFAVIRRLWQDGDSVALQLPMEPRILRADSRIEADRNRLCIARGPFVYCAEEADNGKVMDFFIPKETKSADLKCGKFNDGPLNGIVYIDTPALSPNNPSKRHLRLIPYFAWGNRGEKSMQVWIADNPKILELHSRGISPNAADRFEKVVADKSSSGVEALFDGKIPDSSKSLEMPFWSTPRSSSPTDYLIDIYFKTPELVESVQIYWAKCAWHADMPKSWRLQYLSGGKWLDFPVYITDSYQTLPDKYNIVHAGKKITAEALRVVVTTNPERSAAIFEMEIKSSKPSAEDL